MLWEIEGLSGVGDTSIRYDNDVAWSTSSGEPGVGGFDTELFTFAEADSLGIELRSSSSSSQTITGSGVFQSYTAFDSSDIAALEALIGSELNTVALTGFSNIQVQAASTSGSAVPEPSSWLLMLIGAAGLGVRRRLWAKK